MGWIATRAARETWSRLRDDFLAVPRATRARAPLLCIAVLASSLMAAALVGVGWLAWDRGRPDFIYPGLPEGSLRAFPSGHLGTAVPFYGLLAWIWASRSRAVGERIVALLLLTLVLGFTALARVVLSAHWPSDMLAGAVVGTYWLGVVAFALRRAGAT